MDENGGVGSDAEGEGEDGGGGEAGRFGQRAKAEADVLPEGLHWGPPGKVRRRGEDSFIGVSGNSRRGEMGGFAWASLLGGYTPVVLKSGQVVWNE